MSPSLSQASVNNHWPPRSDPSSRSLRGAVRGGTHPFVNLDIPRLTQAVQGGDHAAFTQLYQALFAPLYRYLLVVCRGQEHEAQEVLQETLIRLARNIKSFDHPTDLWNWIRCVARNILIDRLRKDQRRPRHQSLNDRIDVIQSHVEQEDPGQWIEHLEHSLNQLDPGERTLIQGKYLQDQSYRSLAQDHGLTPKAVESRLARIRKKLKTLMLKRLAR